MAALAAQIKQQIMQGVLAPGQRLVEADLSRETGASRAKVREALRAFALLRHRCQLRMGLLQQWHMLNQSSQVGAHQFRL